MLLTIWHPTTSIALPLFELGCKRMSVSSNEMLKEGTLSQCVARFELLVVAKAMHSRHGSKSVRYEEGDSKDRPYLHVTIVLSMPSSRVN